MTRLSNQELLQRAKAELEAVEKKAGATSISISLEASVDHVVAALSNLSKLTVSAETLDHWATLDHWSSYYVWSSSTQEKEARRTTRSGTWADTAPPLTPCGRVCEHAETYDGPIRYP